MVPEDGVKDFFGVEEVGAEDGVDAGEGAAEVFGYEVGGDVVGEGSAAIPKRGRCILECFEVTDICYKGRIFIRNQVLFTANKEFLQLGQAFSCFAEISTTSTLLSTNETVLLNVLTILLLPASPSKSTLFRTITNFCEAKST